MNHAHATLTALITGGSSGLGEAMAVALSRSGHRIILVSENQKELSRAGRACLDAGATLVHTICLDCTACDAAQRLYDECATRGLAVDVLINCAGIYTTIERELSDLSCIDAVVNLHVLTLTKLCLLFGRDMVSRRRGYILNVSSIASGFPDPASLTYGPSKRYVRSFSDAIHCEWKEYGVKVTCMTPGGINTNFFAANNVFIPPIIRRTLISAQDCAQAGLRAMFRGKRRVTPGLYGKLQSVILSVISRPITYPLIKKSYFSMKDKAG